MTEGEQEIPSGDATATKKADLGRRAVAVIIDGLLAGVVSILLVGVGGLIALAYMLLRDGFDFEFMRFRSLGKAVMKLHVESTVGAPLDLLTSVKRNWVFAVGWVGAIFAPFPFLNILLVPLFGFAALVIGVIELFLVISDAEGRRFGDKLAGTIVAED